MNIVVCAKQVVDVGEIKVNPSSGKPMLEGIPKKISDIDKNACEEAIRVREKVGGKVTVLTVGTPDAKERMKELLAMGADNGVLVTVPEKADHLVTSTLISKAIQKMGGADLIICAEASIDQFSGQIGPRVAGLLNIPQLTYCYKVTAEPQKLTAERNLGDRLVTSESSYPVLVTVTKEVNQPRLPSLMQILGSAKKPIEVWGTSDIGAADLKPGIETIDIKGVAMSRKNIVFKDDLDESVSKLADSLSKEGLLG